MFSCSKLFFFNYNNNNRAVCTNTLTKKIINLNVVGGNTDKRFLKGKTIKIRMYRVTGDLGWERSDVYSNSVSIGIGIGNNVGCYCYYEPKQTKIIDYGDDNQKESELWYCGRTNIRKIIYFNDGQIQIHIF